MLLLRKIDCYGQLVFANVVALSCFFWINDGVFLIGLFILGWWQVFSAILNTYCFAQCGFTQRIFHYWLFCLGDLFLFFFSSWLNQFTGYIVVDLLIITSLTGGVVLAGYYWWIYYRLIGFIFLRNELDGLTKSKH